VPSELAWERDPLGGSGWVNWVSGEKSAEKPASLALGIVAVPTEPPPPPPVNAEEQLAAFMDEDQDAGDGFDAEADRLAQIVYPPHRGMLKKKGGGYTFMGSKTWKARFFVSQHGSLSYYENEADATPRPEPGVVGGPLRTKPKKHVTINLHNYVVDECRHDPSRFALVPTADAFMAFVNANGEGVPQPDRVFELEAFDRESKIKWVLALRGRRLLDAHRQTRISLTENFAMLPTAAVSGFYFSHPKAAYFGVARIGKTSFEIGCALFSGDTCVGVCDSIQVAIGENGPTLLPSVLRDSLEKKLLIRA
jgi:hypothetical protein